MNKKEKQAKLNIEKWAKKNKKNIQIKSVEGGNFSRFIISYTVNNKAVDRFDFIQYSSLKRSFWENYADARDGNNEICKKTILDELIKIAKKKDYK